MKFSYSNDKSPPALILPVRIFNLGNKKGIESSMIVDTGADITVISDEIREELHLAPRGYTFAKGVLDKNSKRHPTYFITVSINDKLLFNAEVIASQNDYSLMGRDVLNRIILTANGPLNFFKIKEP